MRIPNGLLAIVLAGVALTARAADDDESFIARQMAAAHAPGLPVAAERAPTLTFADLARMGGRRVLVERTDGSSTRGQIERADAEVVVLRVLGSNAWSTVTLARADIRTIKGA